MSRSSAGHVRWSFGIFVLVICFVAYLDRIAFSVSASPLMDELDITPVQFGLATTVFNIGYFALQIPSGMLIRRVGPRWAMAIALLGWSLFTGLTGLANSLTMLLAVRALFGAAEAPVFPSANSFFANWFPAQERGRANAMMNAGGFLGPAVGAILLVPMIGVIGWRGGFLVCFLLGAAITVIWVLLARDHPTQHRAVGASEQAVILEGRERRPAPQRAPWGVFLRSRSFWALALAFFGTLWVVQFFIYWLPYYLEKGLGVPFAHVGTYTSASFVVIVVSVLVAGTASDRILRATGSRFLARNVLSLAGLVVAASCLLLSTTTQSVPLGVLWLSIALGGAGFAQTLAWTIATDIGREFTATVGSWMNMWGFIAAAIVPTVAPALAERLGWTAVITLDAAVAVLGIVGFLLVRSDTPLISAPDGSGRGNDRGSGDGTDGSGDDLRAGRSGSTTPA
ncbi:MFS transporter [Brachybacterium sp. ACRRE]|uniref:MFS transporter n=1 Tax=Brachybacterium sp. ACRRE TaxID=2918184 RepID=UPI001EF2A2E1|nr:MFS transporter [Brachybacterium sp. ACRRE]MCG7310341.1 MFS transporter [Brachybacterium sp. ACRRE]